VALFFTLYFLELFMSLFRLKAVKALVLAGIVGGLVVSCNEASSPIVGGTQVVDKSVASSSTKGDELVLAMKNGETNAQLAALAKSVASTLAESNTAKAVHIQAMRKFDGCTNVLWNNLNTDQNLTSALGASGNWTATVARNGAKFNLQANDVQAALEQYSRHYAANAHLYWYNAEKWDGKTSPLVTFVPVLAKGQDIDKMPSEVIAYDAQGKEYIVNEAIAKTRPVIVIAPNERTEMNGQLKQAVAENLNRPRMTSPKGGAQLQNSYMSITSLSFSDAFEGTWFIEHWILGDPEFYAIVTSVPATGGDPAQWGRFNLAGAVPRHLCNGQYFSTSYGAPWNTGFHKSLHWQWFEEDGGAEVELGLSATFKLSDNISISPSFKVKYKIQDNVLSQMTVHYDDVFFPIAPFRTYAMGNPSMILSW
jgi:hypothetical protein